MSKSYFEQRMEELGVNEANINIKVRLYNNETGSCNAFPSPIPTFWEDSDGNIVIECCDINRQQMVYDNKYAEPTSRNQNNNRTGIFRMKRLKNPYIDKDGSQVKYLIPKSELGTKPFFPELVLQAFETATEIDTLFITEGYFKAWKGAAHGMYVVGSSSIYHFRDKATQKLYPDIEKLIRRCQVKRVVILHDGDCLNISNKAIEWERKEPDSEDKYGGGVDLYKRLHSFYNAVYIGQELLKPICTETNTKITYAHILGGLAIPFPVTDLSNVFPKPVPPKVDRIETANLFDTFDDCHYPKGLDDLLIAMKGKEKEVIKDFFTSAKDKPDTEYFHRTDITNNPGKLRKYFNIVNVDMFYAAYQELIRDKEFIFNGTAYKFDQEKQQCKMTLPRDAKNYARVGTDYYKFVRTPNQDGHLETRLANWSRTTILEDYKKEFLEYVPKYEGFCNVPDHKNWQKVIHNCLNMYNEFEWIPQEGEIPNIMKYMKHIFGEETIYDKRNDKTFPSYELGLDYLQLLYLKPTQKLPILALVSREQKTGKTTFGNLLSAIFKANAAEISNDDWENDFNSFMTDKLLIMTEEAFLEKDKMYQKIKALSTGKTIMENRKGKEQIKRDFFGKFIFFSNNEATFMRIDHEETRFWVRKIPRLKSMDPFFEQKLISEIPALLHFLENRKLVTENEDRMWFRPELIWTEALGNVIENSRPKAERMIKDAMKEFFLSIPTEDLEAGNCLLFTSRAIQEAVLGGKYDVRYITDLLKHNFQLDNFRDENGKIVTKRIKYPKQIIIDGEVKNTWFKDRGIAWIFPREKFLSKKDLETYAIATSEEIAYDKQEELSENLNGHDRLPI